VEAGPLALFDGIATLERGENIDLRGASTRLDLDAKTGEGAIDFALICPTVDAQGRAKGEVEAGVYYRPATGKTDGAVNCP
jgi:hypothetical protein